MQKLDQPSKWRHVIFFATGLFILIADQFSKNWIRYNLPEGKVLFDIGFFQIKHIQNTGAAFGLFRDGTLILSFISLFAAVFILVYALFLYRRYPFFEALLGRVTLGLIFGGTVGNLIDRFRLGYVTDFLDFKIWPSFNVADSAVTVGTILLAYYMLRLTRANK